MLTLPLQIKRPQSGKPGIAQLKLGKTAPYAPINAISDVGTIRTIEGISDRRIVTTVPAIRGSAHAIPARAMATIVGRAEVMAHTPPIAVDHGAHPTRPVISAVSTTGAVPATGPTTTATSATTTIVEVQIVDRTATIGVAPMMIVAVADSASAATSQGVGQAVSAATGRVHRPEAVTARTLAASVTVIIVDRTGIVTLNQVTASAATSAARTITVIVAPAPHVAALTHVVQMPSVIPTGATTMNVGIVRRRTKATSAGIAGRRKIVRPLLIGEPAHPALMRRRVTVAATDDDLRTSAVVMREIVAMAISQQAMSVVATLATIRAQAGFVVTVRSATVSVAGADRVALVAAAVAAVAAGVLVALIVAVVAAAGPVALVGAAAVAVGDQVALAAAPARDAVQATRAQVAILAPVPGHAAHANGATNRSATPLS